MFIRFFYYPLKHSIKIHTQKPCLIKFLLSNILPKTVTHLLLKL